MTIEISRGHDDGTEASRYKYDAMFKASEGWEQYDTDQDAWYFGVWVNYALKQVFTFAEGDTSMETGETVEDYACMMCKLEEFYTCA